MDTNTDKDDESRIVLNAIAYTAQLFTDLHERVRTYAEMLRIVDPVAADHLLRVALVGVGAATDEITDWILNDSGTS
ncbi:hypothetical protein [Arthrobacter sp. HLT1-20]